MEKRNYETVQMVCLTLEDDVLTLSGETDNLQHWSTDWFPEEKEGGSEEE